MTWPVLGAMGNTSRYLLAGQHARKHAILTRFLTRGGNALITNCQYGRRRRSEKLFGVPKWAISERRCSERRNYRERKSCEKWALTRSGREKNPLDNGQGMR